MNYFRSKKLKYDDLGSLLWRSMEVKMINRLMKDLKFKDPILDLGCGNTEVTKLLFPKKKIYGIDLVTEFVDDIVHYGEITNLEAADDSYDTVFSNCVFEHIPDIKKALSEVSRVLKKDGYFIFTVTSPFWKKNLFFKNPIYSWIRSKRAGICNHYYIQEWWKMLKPLGMELVRAEYFMDRQSTLLFDKLAWFYFLGWNQKKYIAEAESCYHNDKGRWGSSGIAMIAKRGKPSEYYTVDYTSGDSSSTVTFSTEDSSWT